MVMNYNNQNRAKAAEKNEIMIKSSTGVSLTFLAGVYVRPQAQDKIVQALGEVGFSSEEVAQLLNWKKTYSYNFPFSELQNSDVVEICQKNKGSKIFWEDLTGNQPYIEAGEWFSAADGKSLQDISKWLTGQELLVRLVNRYRLRMRVTRVYEANGALYLDYTEVESPALKSKVAFDDLLQVGFISSGVLDQYCQSVVSEGSF
jgi:hypothetical protein